MTRRTLLVLMCGAFIASERSAARQADASMFAGLQWRLIGPFRAGRVSAVAGVAGDPTTYYIGTPDGGLWKTTDGGTMWSPAFDAVKVPSIGAVAVAASNPSIVYAGTGHNLLGQGVFRSTDAGATWRPAGLADSKYINALVIDPRNPDVVLAGVGSGGNFGTMVYYNNNPHPARGIHRTTDGGRTWTQVLTVSPQASAIDLVIDPGVPAVVFASLAGSGLFRSTDGGATWVRLAAAGFGDGGGSITLAVALGTNARRLYGLIGGRGAGLYRSDDGGDSWTLGTSRLASASGRLYVDPVNPDVVYTMGTSMYRSTDGGRTLEARKGAPGGDDNRSMWIDPRDPRRMIIGADQGPTITVDGGATWTPWYVVPNGEHYFVTADDQSPYWIYAAQQDSGTVAIRSRGDYGAIRASDWYPVSGYEQGHIFADPLETRYVYSHGGGHTVLRFDRQTGQVGPVFIPGAQDRFGPRPAMSLSPKDPHRLYLGAQHVFETRDRGATWTKLSGDLTGGNGTLVALAPSPLDADLLWAGSSTGFVHVTRDGGRTWTNVSPPGLASEPTLTLWSMEASSHDAGAAYAAAIDLSDRHAPKLYRTLDFGATWQSIVQGLDGAVPARVVREDPQQRSLLYAGTQAGVWVSFDRGDHWQPLQLNLPVVAINDLAVHGDDLIAATWGRALWVLDNVTPLRQIDAARDAADTLFLFDPAPVVRARWDVNQDTPVPPEVPVGRNPPDGAIIDYVVKGPFFAPLTLTVLDDAGDLVREYRSEVPPAAPLPMTNVPAYWFKPADADRLSTAAGMHRVVWDLRYPTPPSLNYGADGEPSLTVSYGIIAPAVIGQSPRQQPQGPLVLPGTYQVKLNADGKTVSRQLRVNPDLRVRIATEDLAVQLGWQRRLLAGIAASRDAIEGLRTLRRAAADRLAGGAAPAAVTAAAQALDRAALSAIGSLTGNRVLAQRLAELEQADMRPSASVVSALEAGCAAAADSIARYRQVVEREAAACNAALTAARLPPLPGVPPVGSGCR